ncbi:hypothetical protein IAT38_000492 [Cryptococcus sp. DSM 104549]
MSYLAALAFTSDLSVLGPKLLRDFFKGDFSHEEMFSMAWKAISICMALAMFRQVWSYSSFKITQAFFPTAYISITDPAYDWITGWIAQDPGAQSQIHDFELLTSDNRSIRRGARSTSGIAGPHIDRPMPGRGALREHTKTWKGGDVIGQVMPLYGRTLRIVHDNKWLWVTRRSSGLQGAGSGYHYRVRTMFFQRSVLVNFLAAAHQAFYAKEDKELLIFHAKRINPTWQKPVSRPARPWSSVILPPGLKEGLAKDVSRFLSDREVRWYASRGIPHRRGYMFHGEPGSGKTTLVTALASKMDLSIYVINPAQRGMDDAKLCKLFRDCPSKSLILIEDIDCIFPRGRGRGPATNRVAMIDEEDEPHADAEVGEQEGEKDGEKEPGAGKHDLSPSTVTMSGLLNAIDGVSSQEGCVLIATTNHLNRLDSALSRAGRFDVSIEFKHAIPTQARDLYLHFYPLEDFKPLPPSSPDAETSEAKGPEEKDDPFSLAPRAVLKDQKELDGLAQEFVDAIFPPLPPASPTLPSDTEPPTSSADEPPSPPKVAMAALQGYLLRYKEDPFGAAKNAKQWMVDNEELDRARGVQGGLALRSPKKHKKKSAKASQKTNGEMTVEEKKKVNGEMAVTGTEAKVNGDA